ncbi:hypothetical protein [Polluticaenibacter yanchengensis]|uniref:Glycosyltransferase family 1 protein n=1 Tax=Polluticaenibacter yanchengensis TaxID=3014562 RepID=A0ABT4ULG5_9BACT|nr:hypothetical protein [Chitinophagaceae bacterium LY-5]
MNILLNTSQVLLHNKAIDVFCHRFINELATKNTNVNFYITHKAEGLPLNVIMADINLNSWLTVKLALNGFIKKNNIALYVQFGDHDIPSNLPVPTALMLHSQLGVNIPAEFDRKAKWSKLFANADTIIVATDTEKELLEQNFNTLQDKKLVALGVAVDDIFQPVQYIDEIESLKFRYSHELSYIFCPVPKVDDNEEIIQLLKGFSLLKNRHKNSLQLLFYSNSFSEKFIEKLSSYKYRGDILMIEPLEESEYAKILAAATFTIHLNNNGFATNVLECNKSGVLVFTGVNSNAYYFAGDNVIYYNKIDANELFTLFNKFYVNEHLKNQYIANAYIKSMDYNFEKLAGNFRNHCFKDIV